MSGTGIGTPAVAASTTLFTVAEARAFNDATLASATDYPDAVVLAFEQAFREWFTRAAGCDMLPTTHTDEVHSGDGTRTLLLRWPKASVPTAAATRAGATWTALTAGELACLFVDPECDSRLYREDSYWPIGVANVRVTYVAGYATEPELAKEAALTAAVEGIPASNVPYEASSYDAGGGSYTFERADGYNENWSKLPVVMRCLRLYGMRLPGIA